MNSLIGNPEEFCDYILTQTSVCKCEYLGYGQYQIVWYDEDRETEMRGTQEQICYALEMEVA